MQKFYSAFLALIAILFSFYSNCQTNPVPQLLPYSQNFEILPHNVIVYPAGWQGWTIGTSNTATFRTNAPTANRDMVASGSAGNNSGNVYNYNSKIGFLTTGSLDLAIALAIDGTNSSNITVSYSAMTIRNPYDGGSNTRMNEMILQYRIGTTGIFSNLASTEYQNNIVLQTSTGITTPQNVQAKTIALPSSCNNQPIIQLRWVNRDVSGFGSRPSFAIDDISIESSIVVSETVSVLAINNAAEPD
nr:endonuclease [Flavisolibacter sp.]